MKCTLKFLVLLLSFVSLSSNCTDPIRDGEDLGLIGKSEKEIHAKYGRPDYKRYIEVSNEARLYEYQRSLYDVLEREGKPTLDVKQIGYELSGKERLIWFVLKENEFRVVDALEWPEELRIRDLRDSIRDGEDLGLIGKSEKEIHAKYGRPDAEGNIEVSTNEVNLYEYQGSLYDVLEREGKTTLDVKEISYKLPGKKRVVWFVLKENELRVVDALEWPEEIRF